MVRHTVLLLTEAVVQPHKRSFFMTDLRWINNYFHLFISYLCHICTQAHIHTKKNTSSEEITPETVFFFCI